MILSAATILFLFTASTEQGFLHFWVQGIGWSVDFSDWSVGFCNVGLFGKIRRYKFGVGGFKEGVCLQIIFDTVIHFYN